MSLTHKITSTCMLIDLIATIPFQHADRHPTRHPTRRIAATHRNLSRHSAAATDAKDILGHCPESSRSNSSSAPLGDLCAFVVKNSYSSMNMAIRGLPRHSATTPGIDFDFGKEPADTFTRDQHPDLRAEVSFSTRRKFRPIAAF